MDAQAPKLISSMATRELLADMAAGYSRDTTHTVTAEAAGGVDVAKRVRSGEHVDVVVLAATARPDAAHALLEYLAAPDRAALARRHGMEPV